jgi:outer membrane protein
VLVLGMVCAAAAARAESENLVSVGWAYIDPRSSSGPLTVTEIGGQPVDQPQAGTGVKLLPANTLLLSYERDWDDHLSTQLALGVPPTHELRGTGTLAPFGVLGEGQQWSPALIMKWHFLEPGATWRPYLGLGVSYTWYRRSRITNGAFVAAFYGPAATTKVSVSPSWSPVATAGIDWRLGARWSFGLSLAYAPLKTHITVEADNTQFGVPVTVVTEVQTHTLAGGVSLGYRF